MKHNATDTIKVPLQQKNKSGKTSFGYIPKAGLEETRRNKTGTPTILAYLRKSTKNKQEDSIPTQNQRIIDYSKKLGYTIEEENKFCDAGYSGYNKIKTKDGRIIYRPRKGFSALLEKINEQKDPCILFAYNPSRVARNSDDGGHVVHLIKGDTEKKKIQTVYFAMGKGTFWDSNKLATDMKQTFVDTERESETKSVYAIDDYNDKTKNGIYKLSTPKGIDRLKAGEKALKTNEYMPFVLKAWEMKAEGKDKGQIKRYLQLHGLNAPDSFEAYFRNTLYIGYYTNKNTGEMLAIRFEAGKPPMDRELWERVQKTLGPRRVSKYGDKQINDVIARLIRWEEDIYRKYAFSGYMAKGKFKAWKNNAFGGGGFSWIKLKKEFSKELIKLFIELTRPEREAKKEEWKEIQSKMNAISEEIKTTRKEGKFTIEVSDNLDYKIDEIIKESEEFKNTQEEEYKNMCKRAFERIRQTIGGNTEDTEKEMKELEMEKLDKEAREIENEKKTITSNFLKLKNPALFEDNTNEEIQEKNKKLSEIEDRKEELLQSTNMEEYIKRLPEIFNKTFELAERTLNKEENETFEKDIEKLLELVTFELTLSNKKELKVKLFEVFHNMENAGNCEWLPKPASIRTFIENYDRIAEKYGDEF